MADPYKFTLLELLAIIAGALAFNAYLVHRDHAAAQQIIEDTRRAEQFVGPSMFCDQAPEREECEQ